MTKDFSYTKAFLGHPRGLFPLFMMQLCESFTFYGMNGILYMFLMQNATGGFRWSPSLIVTIYGFVLLLNAIMMVPGGFVADRYLGKKGAVLLGGLLRCIGQGLFMIPYTEPWFFLGGLSLALIGVGLLQGNLAALLGGLYKKDDPKRERAFSFFFLASNIGGLCISIWMYGLLQKFGFHYASGILGGGSLFALLLYMLFWKNIEVLDGGLTIAKGKRYFVLWNILILLLCAGMGGWIYYRGNGQEWLRWLEVYRGVIFYVVGYTVFLSMLWHVHVKKVHGKNEVERKRMTHFISGFIMMFCFLLYMNQAYRWIGLYVQKYSIFKLGEASLPKLFVDNVESISIVALGLLVSVVLMFLRKRYAMFNENFQMSIGHILVGISFAVLLGAHKMYGGGEASLDKKVNFAWILGFYFVHIIGQLCLMPVFCSLTSNAAPRGGEGLLMGVTFSLFGLFNMFSNDVGMLSFGYKEIHMLLFLTIVPTVIGFFFLVLNRWLPSYEPIKKRVTEELPADSQAATTLKTGSKTEISASKEGISTKDKASQRASKREGLVTKAAATSKGGAESKAKDTKGASKEEKEATTTAAASQGGTLLTKDQATGKPSKEKKATEALRPKGSEAIKNKEAKATSKEVKSSTTKASKGKNTKEAIPKTESSPAHKGKN